MPVLQFKGKAAVECYHHTVPHHVLEFDPKLSVLGKGEKPGLDGNLIIEGDNLLALKALLPTHAGNIKCIYIDPPYNTGNEGWVYNDNLTQPQFYVALCPELDVASQGATAEEATANLKEAVELFLESADPKEIKHRLHSEVFVTRFDATHG